MCSSSNHGVPSVADLDFRDKNQSITGAQVEVAVKECYRIEVDHQKLKQEALAFLTQEEYLKLFEQECKEEIELTNRKNRDYAGDKDAFQNFRAVEFLSQGRIPVEDGIIVRMTDKFQRIINLLDGREAKVKDEAITDTLRDLSVYAKILKIYITQKRLREQV